MTDLKELWHDFLVLISNPEKHIGIKENPRNTSKKSLFFYNITMNMYFSWPGLKQIGPTFYKFNCCVIEKSQKMDHALFSFSYYSQLPIIRTFKGNRKKFELWGVRVIEGKII